MYEWIKALHVIAVIAWMAGMLYLPRLFVYHCEAEGGSKQSETFKVMERRLLKAIINPGNDRDMVSGTLPRLGRPFVFGGLVSRQAAAGAAAVGRPRFFCPLREGFRRRPEYTKSEILSYLSTRYRRF